MRSIEHTDVAIIGGGFYGAFAANEIKTNRPDLDVVLLEKETEPFTHASSTNQGQFHMGYMYSGDKELASECVENIKRFSSDFKDAIDDEVTSLYGVHEDSQISADEFAEFCEGIGLPVKTANDSLRVFGSNVLHIFETAEKTFNSAAIQRIFMAKLALNNCKLITNSCIDSIEEGKNGIDIVSKDKVITASNVFNATFADINNLHDRSGLSKIPLQHDTFLHFVMDLPGDYSNVAATAVRGPFASLLPSSFRGGHILASGKYRKIRSNMNDKPSEAIDMEEVASRYTMAIKEARDYLPILDLGTYRGHTVGTRAAHIDPDTGAYTSKAMVFKDFDGIKGYHTILGGKVSCMFDIQAPMKNIIDSNS
jgi:glycine/D-amino acid oxidase-like deaminating enzyme